MLVLFMKNVYNVWGIRYKRRFSVEHFDVKKDFKEQYAASSKRISIINVPKYKFIMVDGVGNPSVDEFKLKSKVLKLISKEIKEVLKEKDIICTTPPLEGLWDTYDNSHFDVTRKQMIKFTLMMVQHDCVDERLLEKVKARVLLKSDNPYILDVYCKSFTEGKCVQLLHRGAYNTEIYSTKQIMEYITVDNLKLKGMHHEIYLNNPEKVDKEELKTIVRYAVERA